MTKNIYLVIYTINFCLSMVCGKNIKFLLSNLQITIFWDMIVFYPVSERTISQGFGCSPMKVVRELGCPILCFGVARQFGPCLSWAQDI